MSGLVSMFPAWCGATSFGGQCPVQAEGQIGDAYWYFRARGDSWSITVHNDIERAYGDATGALYYHDESYGVWPEAGYMPAGDAVTFIVRELINWRDSQRAGTVKGLSEPEET